MDEEDQQQFQDDMNEGEDMAGEDEMDMAGEEMEPGMEPGMEEGAYEEGSPELAQEEAGSPAMVAEEEDVTGRRLDGAEESAVIGGGEQED